MNRRSFLAAVAALPLVGKLMPKTFLTSAVVYNKRAGGWMAEDGYYFAGPYYMNPSNPGQICWLVGNQKPPEGWLLCDGTNGTMDLRDKFISFGA